MNNDKTTSLKCAERINATYSNGIAIFNTASECYFCIEARSKKS
jgi:hypothetical protein